MIPGHIPGATLHMKAPEGWNEAEQGHCGTLHVLPIVIEGTQFLGSAWMPTPEELERLNKGAAIYLWISAAIHPVVAMEVGKEPGD